MFLRIHFLAILIIAFAFSVQCSPVINGTDESIEAPDEPIPTEPVAPLTRKVLGGSSRIDVATADLLNRALNVTKSGQHSEIAYEMCRWGFFNRTSKAGVEAGYTALAASTFISLYIGAAGFIGVPAFFLLFPIYFATTTVATFSAFDVMGVIRNRKRLSMINRIYHDEGQKRFTPETLKRIKAIQFSGFNGDIKSINRLANIFNTSQSDAEWIRERIKVYNITQ